MKADRLCPENTLRDAVAATAVALLLAAAICATFSGRVLTTWVALFFIAATPAEIVLALLWKTQHPAAIARLSQPTKGIVLTIITALTGLCIGWLLFRFAGGGVSPPTPMLVMLSMLGIVSILWLIPLWHCWPLSTFTASQTVLGIAVLGSAYALAWLVFKLAFNFSFLAHAPVYVAALDPHGWLNAWTALSALVTTVAVIVVLLLFDFWPLPRLLPSPAQPVFGIAASLYVLAVSAILYAFSTGVVGMDPVRHLVRVAAPLIYGVFLVDLMTRHRLLAIWPQPLRGLALTALAAGLAAVVYPIYAWGAPLLTGEPMASGAPTYELEVWVATAMLGITFPLMVVVASFFDFWPSRGTPAG